MNKKWVRILGTCVLLGLLAWKTNWAEVGNALTHVPLGQVGLAVLIFTTAQLISSVRWWIIGRRLGLTNPPWQYVRLYYVGMFFNLFLPTSVGGDVVRAVQLGAGTGRHGPALRSVLAERLSGLAVLLLLGAVALVLAPGDLPGWLRWSVWALAGLALGGTLMTRFWPGPAIRVPGLRYVVESVQLLLEQRRLLVSTTLLSLIVQLLNVWQVWIIGRALHLPVPAHFYWILVPTVVLLTMLPVSLNGMGVREGATVVLLAPFGVTTGQALTLSWLWFLTASASSLVGVACYLLGRNTHMEERRDARAISDNSDQGRMREPEAAA